MQFTGTLADISIDFKTNKPKITFLINEKESLKQIEEIKDAEKLKIEAKKYRKQRSLDANAYCWVLIGRLSEKLNVPNIDIYKKAIREIGVYEVIPIKTEAVDRYIEIWQGNGLGWICEQFPSKLEGYTNVKAYYGSSVYDTKEMSRLIDNIVTECKEQNIETLSQNEIDSLVKEWSK